MSRHRHHRELSLLFIDADHFKKLNDTHGHQLGDTVLRTMGHLLQGAVRHADLTVRMDASPFAVRHGGGTTNQPVAERIGGPCP